MTDSDRGPRSACPVLWIVIPCYNEEDVLPLTTPLFLGQLSSLINQGKISDRSKICYVDDGSKDRTWDIIADMAQNDPRVSGLRLSRNRGHQNALLCGLMEARKYCDVSISIDCDGQDDISAIERMIDEYASGHEIVYGVRSKRDEDSFFKRTSAELFYKLMSGMGVESVFNHADYRLLSSKVLDHLAEYREVNLFLRGMVPLVGFSSSIVYYERTSRMAGESHYPLSKMLHLAIDGITSLSTKPIKLVSTAGIIFSILGFVGTVWAVLAYFFGEVITGWASTICIVCFIGGLQLLSLGVIGEYVGKIYLEVKQRPRYTIAERTEDNREN